MEKDLVLGGDEHVLMYDENLGLIRVASLLLVQEEKRLSFVCMQVILRLYERGNVFLYTKLHRNTILLPQRKIF